MTDMKRMSVSMPDDIIQLLLELRKTEEYCKCSYSEIIRRLVVAGYGQTQRDKKSRQLKGEK